MSEHDEVSPGGSRMYRHTGEGKEFEFAAGDETVISQVEDHMTRAVGEAGNVFHEIISHLVHVDVHVVEPTAERDYFVLYTTGMSERPMTVPEAQMRSNGMDPDDFRHAELLLALPKTWFRTAKYAEAELSDESIYWPVRLLKTLARLPHEYDTWFGAFHTIPNGDPPAPVAPGTRLAGAMLIHPEVMNEQDHVAKLSDGRRVNFYQVLPLYPEEFDLKLREGAEALLRKMTSRAWAS